MSYAKEVGVVIIREPLTSIASLITVSIVRYAGHRTTVKNGGPKNGKPTNEETKNGVTKNEVLTNAGLKNGETKNGENGKPKLLKIMI